MALPYKPHSLQYEPINANIDEQVKYPPTWDGTTFAFRGQLTPGGYAMIVERFGIELEKPCLLLCDLESAELFKIGGRVWKGSKKYTIKAPPKLWDAVSPTFAEVALEELDHA